MAKSPVEQKQLGWVHFARRLPEKEEVSRAPARGKEEVLTLALLLAWVLSPRMALERDQIERLAHEDLAM